MAILMILTACFGMAGPHLRSALAATEIKPGDVLVWVSEAKSLQFFPLVPTVVKNSNGSQLINVFVKDASFGEYTLTVVPTLTWSLSKDQEASLSQMKSDGVKTFSAWPGVSAIAYLYQVDVDGDIKTSKFELDTINVGANTVVELQLPNMDVNDVKDILHGKRDWGILFDYRMNSASQSFSDVDPNWLKRLPVDITAFGDTPIGGAVDKIYGALEEKYTRQFHVDPRSLRLAIERYVKSAPISTYQSDDGTRLQHDFTALMEIEMPFPKQVGGVVEDYFQGRMPLGDLCKSSNSTIFVTVGENAAVGCDALQNL